MEALKALALDTALKTKASIRIMSDPFNPTNYHIETYSCPTVRCSVYAVWYPVLEEV
jgi:hypothetical protein